MDNNILIGLFAIQIAILIAILAFNINMVKELKKMKDRQALNPNTPFQPPVLKNNLIPPLSAKSVNLNETVRVDKEEEHAHVLAFVSPLCSACKDLLVKANIDQSMKGKLIVVTDNTDNLEFYNNMLTDKGIPIIQSDALRIHLGIRAYPTVVQIDKELKVKEYFVGSNFVKFKEFIESA